MTRTHRRLALAAALALGPALLGGCAAVGELAKAAFQAPRLTFKAVRVTALDFDGATLELEYLLSNPNGFGLSLARVQYWLQVEGRLVTRGEVREGLRIPAAGEVPLRFSARLPFKEVPRLLELATRGEPVAYQVGGSVGVDTPVGLVELPVEHAGHVDLPRLPEFRIASASVKLASLSEVELVVRVVVHNRNPFPLPKGQLRYGLAVGGEVVATAEGEELQAVAAGGEGHLDIPVRLSISGAGRALGAVLRGGVTDVRLTGQAELGALPVPLDLSGKTGR